MSAPPHYRVARIVLTLFVVALATWQGVALLRDGVLTELVSAVATWQAQLF